MKYSTRTGSLPELATPCLVCSLATARKVTATQRTRAVLDAATQDFKDTTKDLLTVRMPADAQTRRIVVIGGADGEMSPADFRRQTRRAADELARLDVASALWALTSVNVTNGDPYWRASCALTELSIALYRFDAHKSKRSDSKLPAVQMYADGRTRTNVQRAVREGNALKLGLDLARDLGNQPPNVCDPSYLLKEARKLARDESVSVTSLDEKRMRELGMGAFLAVSNGSERPGRMIIVNYQGGARTDAPIVLIGKGITFDTGGISLKPAAAMDEMKFDMCGAAAVLGAAKAAAALKLPLNLITIVAAAENMPSGRATRPGDIVRTYSGKTVEILNTDAEGRLVLCDAISYAARYKPRAVVDVATLTGAQVVALGSQASAVYSGRDELAARLVDAGDWTGDRAWRMPLWEEYQSALDSRFADVANVGGREAGSVTAACFLARFAEGLDWAHMDVAGTAYHSGARKGSTGRPVPLLFRYLLGEAAA